MVLLLLLLLLLMQRKICIYCSGCVCLSRPSSPKPLSSFSCFPSWSYFSLSLVVHNASLLQGYSLLTCRTCLHPQNTPTRDSKARIKIDADIQAPQPHGSTQSLRTDLDIQNPRTTKVNIVVHAYVYMEQNRHKKGYTPPLPSPAN